jgi:hypothetical protein
MIGIQRQRVSMSFSIPLSSWSSRLQPLDTVCFGQHSVFTGLGVVYRCCVGWGMKATSRQPRAFSPIHLRLTVLSFQIYICFRRTNHKFPLSSRRSSPSIDLLIPGHIESTSFDILRSAPSRFIFLRPFGLEIGYLCILCYLSETASFLQRWTESLVTSR